MFLMMPLEQKSRPRFDCRSAGSEQSRWPGAHRRLRQTIVIMSRSPRMVALLLGLQKTAAGSRWHRCEPHWCESSCCLIKVITDSLNDSGTSQYNPWPPCSKINSVELEISEFSSLAIFKGVSSSSRPARIKVGIWIRCSRSRVSCAILAFNCLLNAAEFLARWRYPGAGPGSWPAAAPGRIVHSKPGYRRFLRRAWISSGDIVLWC